MVRSRCRWRFERGVGVVSEDLDGVGKGGGFEKRGG